MSVIEELERINDCFLRFIAISPKVGIVGANKLLYICQNIFIKFNTASINDYIYLFLKDLNFKNRISYCYFIPLYLPNTFD